MIKICLFEKDFVKIVFDYLKNSSLLRNGYTIEEWVYCINKNTIIKETLLTIENYIKSGYEEYIIPELEDHIDIINSETLFNEFNDISIEIKEHDINYVINIIHKYFEWFVPYLQKQALKSIMKSDKRLALAVVEEKLGKGCEFNRNLLIKYISYYLVGTDMPCSCANGKIKKEYAMLLNKLPIYNEI